MCVCRHTHSSSPLADSFLVLMILAAYSCPVEIFMQRLTTEKAPLHERSHVDKQAVDSRRRSLDCRGLQRVVSSLKFLRSCSGQAGSHPTRLGQGSCSGFCLLESRKPEAGREKLLSCFHTRWVCFHPFNPPLRGITSQF